MKSRRQLTKAYLQIRDLFIKKFTETTYYDEPAMAAVNRHWGVAYRDISKYVAKKPFNIKGLFLEAPLYPVQGRGQRHIKAGTVLIVRMDTRTPNKIDIEGYFGVGKQEQVFQCDAAEWRYNEGFLIPLDDILFSKEVNEDSIKAEIKKLRLAGMSKHLAKTFVQRYIMEKTNE